MNSELQQAIMEQLKAPVKRKGSNDYMTDEEGNVVTAMRAIGLSLTAKAMQGDLNAIAFCITVQQQESDDPKAAQAAADRRQQMTDDNRQAIRATLESAWNAFRQPSGLPPVTGNISRFERRALTASLDRLLNSLSDRK